MRNVLIISHTERARAVFMDILSQSKFNEIMCAESAGEARRLLNTREFDLCIINAPLLDEFGEKLAQDITEKSTAQVILAVKADIFDEISANVEDFGVLTVSKPISRTVFWNAVKLASAASTRILMLKQKNTQLMQKIEDIRMVDRAKCILIETLKMSESDAHRYIEKQAMDLRISKRQVAESILKTYEG